MKFFSRHRRAIIFTSLLFAGVSVYLLTKEDEVPDWVTGTVERGTVREFVSVSGVVEAHGEAKLTFPTSGIVVEILAKKGDVVETDRILATLKQSELIAERQDAQGALMIARANREELVSGPRSEERSVTAASVAIARSDLERTISEHREKVLSAYRTLLSSDLEAAPRDLDNSDVPPTISGTYTCGTEGVYTLDMFKSSSRSGNSYHLQGLEEGSFTAYTESPGPLGTCGLSILFDADESYSSKLWDVKIPNTRGQSYTTNLNAYLLAKEAEKNAIEAAEQALDKAEREEKLENAVPRDEALERAQAEILQAESRVAQIDARINDRTLRAPFPGTISDVDFTKGEVSGSGSITVVAADNFELIVRIPEIDITRVNAGQKAEVTFDARSGETVTATVDFIASVATMIDGVAYFEATLRFDNTPSWMRSGLNADVNILVSERTNVLRVAKRFVVREGDTSYLLYPQGSETRRERIEVDFTGNDGFVAVSGKVNEGDIVVAP